MAVCLVMQFSGIDAQKYDSVIEQLGLKDENPDFALGLISHVVGFQGEVANVVDVWESQQHFERFVEERLRPAFDKLGIVSEARIKGFEVYNHAAGELTPAVAEANADTGARPPGEERQSANPRLAQSESAYGQRPA